MNVFLQVLGFLIKMACQKKLNSDDTWETNESSEDEYIPSDHDHVELTDMVFANENEGDIVEMNDVVQEDCACHTRIFNLEQQRYEKTSREEKTKEKC